MDHSSKTVVIVVNFNGKEFLGRCLESLKHQTFSNFKTVVVDNFSHDGSAALIDDSHVVAAVEEERITRVKHDRFLPYNAIDACLIQHNCNIEDVDCLALAGHKAGFERKLKQK